MSMVVTISLVYLPVRAGRSSDTWEHGFLSLDFFSNCLFWKANERSALHGLDWHWLLWMSAHGKRESSPLFITYQHHSLASRNHCFIKFCNSFTWISFHWVLQCESSISKEVWVSHCKYDLLCLVSACFMPVSLIFWLFSSSACSDIFVVSLKVFIIESMIIWVKILSYSWNYLSKTPN